ncbi:MAG: hypothetical protein VX642_08795 [Bdellovibrionota bacterium]|nr:hypothetical protein [Bdellovibrionota bacterium]
MESFSRRTSGLQQAIDPLRTLIKGLEAYKAALIQHISKVVHRSKPASTCRYLSFEKNLPVNPAFFLNSFFY